MQRSQIIGSPPAKRALYSPPTSPGSPGSQHSNVFNLIGYISVNPDILAIQISDEKRCISRQCNALIEVEENNKYAKCSTCGKRILAKKVFSTRNGIMDVGIDEQQLSLHFTMDVVANFVNPDDTVEKIEEALLELENINITYKKNGDSIIQIDEVMC